MLLSIDAGNNHHFGHISLGISLASRQENPHKEIRMATTDLADYWPRNALQAFTLKMASHGHSVSNGMMMRDPLYALEQLKHAHCMSDGELQYLAMELFRHFERHQSRPLAA